MDTISCFVREYYGHDIVAGLMAVQLVAHFSSTILYHVLVLNRLRVDVGMVRDVTLTSPLPDRS